jgi:putative alpha-1,2-mannosidase
VRTGAGRRLIIDAGESSRLNRFIQNASLNGQPFAKTWLSSDALRDAHLRFAMGPLPNKSWAVTPDAAPPSLSPSE